MNPQLKTEYLELLQGVRHYLSDEYPKGTFVCAGKENWEALHRLLVPGRKTVSPQPKAPAAVQPQATRQYSAPMQQNRTYTPPPQATPKPSTVPAEPPPPKKIAEEKSSRSLHLSEPPTAASIDMTEWKKIFIEKFPHIPLIESPLSAEAEKVAVCIVHGAVSPQELSFIENIARSCHLLLGKTKVIAAELFRPEEGRKFFTYGVQIEHGIPIQPFSFYLHNPQAKALLWRQLTAETYE